MIHLHRNLTQKFQSTLPQGEWPLKPKGHGHATYFNPHSHKGSDASSCGWCRWIYISIHTPTRGVTLFDVFLCKNLYNFNPHSHKGSDHSCFCQPIPIRNFNPHSHKGSDACSAAYCAAISNFNPHSHKGSDGILWSYWLCHKISIHTPTRGVTTAQRQGKNFTLYFNPHSHKGSDSNFYQ